MCRYFDIPLPDPKEVPKNILEERSQELDSLQSIYDSCQEIITHQLWYINLNLPCLTELYEDTKPTRYEKKSKKPDKDVCRYYMKGICKFADRCHFSHHRPVRDVKPSVIDENKNKFVLEVRFPYGRYFLMFNLISKQILASKQILVCI